MIFVLISKFVSTSLKNVFKFSTSERGKRIMIFEDEKINEVRFSKKSGIKNVLFITTFQKTSHHM